MFTPPNMSRVMCHVSRVTCHMSRVTCHMSPVTIFFILFIFFLIFFFRTKWLGYSVEGLLSTEPTPSSLIINTWYSASWQCQGDSRKRKVEPYKRLNLDINDNGIIVDNCPLEAAARKVINVRSTMEKNYAFLLRLGLVDEIIENICGRQFHSAMI